MIYEMTNTVQGVTGGRPGSETGKTAAVEGKARIGESAVTATTAATAAETGKDGATRPVDRQQLTEIVGELNDFAQSVQRQLEFSIDQDNGEVVVRVVDARTKDVVREIPPEEIREMQKRLGEISDQLFRNQEKTALLFQDKA